VFIASYIAACVLLLPCLSGRRILFIIGLVATVAVAVLVTRLARRALDRELEGS
jgi:uncharacterized membrane protein